MKPTAPQTDLPGLSNTEVLEVRFRDLLDTLNERRGQGWRVSVIEWLWRQGKARLHLHRERTQEAPP
jgi:hypothetical protein